MRSPTPRAIAVLLIGSWVLAACVHRSPDSPVLPSPTDPCVIGSRDAAATDTLVIALPNTLAAQHAPVPLNDAERLAFRQVYATLVHLDCSGQPRSGLAEHWTSDSSGVVWTFKLGDHRFDNGLAVTAPRVIESWSRYRLAHSQPRLERVEASDERTLRVTFATRDTLGPRLFAHPAFSVGWPNPEVFWPRSSGGFRLEPPRTAPTDERRYWATAVGGGLTLDFRVSLGADTRDQLAAGVDLLVTRDPATLDYASRGDRFTIAALPWDRTYFLVSPAAPPVDPGRDSVTQARFRAALARDAVRVDARGAEPPFEWPAPPGCPADISGAGALRPRIVYPLTDSTARALAERIVAIASVRLTPAGLDEAALAAALRASTAAAFILPLPRLPPASCHEVPTLPTGATVTPLIDTRAHLILRRGTARVTVDADGLPRILPDTSQ